MYKHILLKANAKINFYLDILAKRDDGYHDIFTLLQSISLADTVDIERTKQNSIEIVCDYPNVATGVDNIAYKAVQAFSDYTGINAGLKIDINKRIPTQAGLGGGSADAAAVIIGLTELFELNLTQQELMEIGSHVGSDVPFCLLGGTAVATGRGEKVDSLLQLEPIKLLIVQPNFQISTAWAYSQYAQINLSPRLIEEVIPRLYSRMRRPATLYNIFEVICSSSYPQINQIKQEGLALGAEFVQMSGSGSAFFMASSNDQTLDLLEEQFAAKDYFTARCVTADKGAEVLALD